jgi:hypothetical protein
MPLLSQRGLHQVAQAVISVAHHPDGRAASDTELMEHPGILIPSPARRSSDERKAFGKLAVALDTTAGHPGSAAMQGVGHGECTDRAAPLAHRVSCVGRRAPHARCRGNSRALRRSRVGPRPSDNRRPISSNRRTVMLRILNSFVWTHESSRIGSGGRQNRLVGTRTAPVPARAIECQWRT